MARMLRQIVVVVRKELRDSLRDGRALFSIAFTVVIGPVLIGFMMNRVADRQREAEEVRLPVVGQEHAPALVQWLRQQSGIEIATGPVDAERAVRERTEDVVVVIVPEFGDRFRVSRPATVKLVADSSRAAARPKVERVRRLLQRYSAEIGSLRLIARGVSPQAMTPLQLEEVEVSTAQQRAAQRSEEHTSELQSLAYLVCRLLLEKKNKIKFLGLLTTSFLEFLPHDSD